jgi:hypothetical protein
VTGSRSEGDTQEFATGGRGRDETKNNKHHDIMSVDSDASANKQFCMVMDGKAEK